MNRRGLLLGFASLLAAPAIVRASSLMPVKALPTRFVPTDWALEYRQEFIAVYEQNMRHLRQTIEENVSGADAFFEIAP